MNNTISQLIKDKKETNNFDYIVASNPIEDSVNTCLPILEKIKNSDTELYRDDLYIIYGIKEI